MYVHAGLAAHSTKRATGLQRVLDEAFDFSLAVEGRYPSGLRLRLMAPSERQHCC